MSDGDRPLPRERIVYQTTEEFNGALDKAAESIHKAKGPDVLGNTVFYGLIVALAVLYTTHWWTDWNLRKGLGVDLVKPIWVLLIGLTALWIVHLRSQQKRIVAKRLCFGCGTSLLGVPTDKDGNGACPNCTREYNCGQYRPPLKNRGREFQGYRDREHFDKAMYEATEYLRRRRGNIMGDFLGWSWVGLGISFLLDLTLGWDLPKAFLGVLPVEPSHIPWLIVNAIGSGVYAVHIKRIQPRIAAHRLCLNCGYSLMGTPADEDGFGRCPECGETFCLAQYDAPPADDDEGTDDPDDQG